LKKFYRFFLFFIYFIGSICIFYFIQFRIFNQIWSELIIDWSFWAAFIFFLISVEEFYNWAKIGRRSELSDIVAIAFFFFLIFFVTKDLLTSLMGAFSIYLWVGVIELKEYPVINKLLIISLVTYNIIFIAGLISFYLEDPFFINTAFAFSFWIILGLGFLLFGRKYIIVWRFMSPAYLILFLYIIGWLAVIFINQYTMLNFNIVTPIGAFEIELIYPILIGINWLIYFISGPILDKLLGIKKIKDENLLNLVENVKRDIGIKGKVKVGYGKYPILNALAYGSFLDNRIALIAESLDQIPEDEIKGIVAHELAHTKGKHTLILTFIATFDLFIRMILGFPASYYDYTFGQPDIPMITFIALNFVIYFVLYFFVRILEGRADLMAKNAGYANELAKALYNLESFYATGREIGLNTMLLCDEKITKDNQLLDYLDTAEYLFQSMIKPSRASLLANFMNSHPPSYFRLAAILGDNLKPLKEALLPIICLKRSKQIKYAKKFTKARNSFKFIANEKFKEFFDIQDVPLLLEKLGRKNTYNLEINNDFLFKNKITNELIIGKLENVQFLDNICDADQYHITNYNTKQKEYLNASLYTKTEIKLNEIYYLEKDTPLLLKDIKLNENKVDGNYLFMDNDKEILKTVKKTKLPNPAQLIENFRDHDLFLKLKGKLEVFRCVEVYNSNKFEDFELELQSLNNEENIKLKLKELIILPKNISLSITRNTYFRKSELELIKWLIRNHIRVYIYLKKPVNNLETGYIQKVNYNLNNLETNISNGNYLIVENIFQKEIKIPYKLLELISFQYNSAVIKKKSEISMFSKLGYKILKKVKPKSIFYLNKV